MRSFSIDHGQGVKEICTLRDNDVLYQVAVNGEEVWNRTASYAHRRQREAASREQEQVAQMYLRQNETETKDEIQAWAEGMQCPTCDANPIHNQPGGVCVNCGAELPGESREEEQADETPQPPTGTADLAGADSAEPEEPPLDWRTPW